MTHSLPPGYRIVELPYEEFEKHWNEWGPQVFSDNDTSTDLRRILSEQERAQLRGLFQSFQVISLNLCIFKGDEFCGWFTGEQYMYEAFYMRNSAILPAHRRKGLYTALMHEVLRRVKDMGFQVVRSHHTNTNNAIIIPKLRAGFVITGLELSDRFGTLVHLSYFFNPTRRQILEFRAGDLRPDQQIKEALRLETPAKKS